MRRTRSLAIGITVVLGLGIMGWRLQSPRHAPAPVDPTSPVSGVQPIQLPKPEDLGIVLPPGPASPTPAVTASAPSRAPASPRLTPEKRGPAPRSVHPPGKGLTPPPEALEQLERDGAVVY